MICASTAKQFYRLSEKDLEELYCKHVRNPHYSSAAPMRLYDEFEVQKVSREKAERLLYEEDHADEIKAEKLANKKRIAKELVDRSARTIDSWKTDVSRPNPCRAFSDSGLPSDVWSNIITRLCDDIEIDGVRSVSVVARDICNASLACREMNAANHMAFRHLALQCSTLRLRGVGDDGVWDRFLSTPLSVRLPAIKTLTKALGLITSATKGVLVLQLLRYFGVDRPSNVPARVLNAVQIEKLKFNYRLSRLCSSIPELKSFKSHNPFWIRCACVSHGFSTIAALELSFRRASEGLIAAEQAERVRLSESRSREAEDRNIRLSTEVVLCLCGSRAAMKCSLRSCAACCPGPCGRHLK